MSGVAGFRLECALLSTLFAVAIRVSLDGGGDADAPTSTGRTAMSLSLEPWVGRDICEVPFFREVQRLATCLQPGAKVQLVAQLPGENVAGPVVPATCGDGLPGVLQALSAIEKARAVVAALGTPIRLQRLVQSDDLERVDKLHGVAVLGEYREPAEDLVATFRGRKVRREVIPTTPATLRSIPKDGTMTVDVFGGEVVCPVGEFEFTHAVGTVRRDRLRKETVVRFAGTEASEFVTRRDAPPDHGTATVAGASAR